jgi:hypothetical protein
MKRKTLPPVAFAILLLASAIVGTHFVGNVKANPFVIFKSAPPIPGTIPPTITISTPENDTVYASNIISLQFNMAKPQPPETLEAGLTFIYYYLDGKRNVLYSCHQYPPPGLPEFSYSKNLTISEGTHKIEVCAVGVVIPEHLTMYSMDSNASVFFTVETDSTYTASQVTTSSETSDSEHTPPPSQTSTNSKPPVSWTYLPTLPPTLPPTSPSAIATPEVVTINPSPSSTPESPSSGILQTNLIIAVTMVIILISAIMAATLLRKNMIHN